MAILSERKDRTGSRAVSAARGRFKMQGFAGRTIRDVPASSGVGTALAHFGDNASLLEARLEHQTAPAVRQSLHTLQRALVLTEQRWQLAWVLFDSYAGQPGLSREMLLASVFPDSSGPHSGRHISSDPNLKPSLAELAGLCRAALARGELTRLPAASRLAAHGWSSADLLSLVAGLAATSGEPAAPATVPVQLGAFRQPIAVQLMGRGAPISLLQPPEAP